MGASAVFSWLIKAVLLGLETLSVLVSGLLSSVVAAIYPPIPDFAPPSISDVEFVEEKYSIADYKIVYGEEAVPAEITAANTLAETLGQITGIDYSAREGTPSAAKEILVGQVCREDVSALGDEGYLIKRKGEDILITGGIPRGTLYGVYRFLEKYFGYRRYTADLILIPSGPAEIAEVEEETYIPPFEYRQTDWGIEDADFMVANRLNSRVMKELEPALGGNVGYSGRFSHTFVKYFLKPEEFFESHPEWYAYRQSVRGRVPTQLCLTNPEVLEQMLLEVMECARQGNEIYDGGKFIIALTQEDNLEYCECENCKAVDDEEGSHAGTLLRFVNAVAEEVEKVYPNVLIDTFAYQYTRTPPKYVRPRSNVVVRLCSIECCFAHALDDPDCNINAVFASDVKRWSEISNHLYIWDYTTNYSHYNCIFPNFGVLQKNMQFFARHNVKGIYEEGNYNAPESDSEFAALRGYLISRLMWDPDLDYDAEINGFCKAYYGAGWQYVREFIDFTTEHTGTKGLFGYRHLQIFDSPKSKGWLRLKPNEIVYADRLWEKAAELAGSQAYRQNVLRSQLSWRFWKAVNRVGEFNPWLRPISLWPAENKRLYDDFESFGIIRYCEGWGNTMRWRLARPKHWLGTPLDWLE